MKTIEKIVEAYIKNERRFTTLPISNEKARASVNQMMESFGVEETIEYLFKQR